MAYKKNYRKRTVARRGKCTYTDIAMKAWKGVKALKGIINSELKNHTIQNNSFNASSTGAVSLISGITQGDSDAQRNGNSVLAKTLNLKYVITNNAAAPGTIVKVYLIKDMQQVSDSNPTFTDVFSTSDIQSFPNWQTKKRFQIKDAKTFVYDTSRLTQIVEFSHVVDSHLLFNGAVSTDVQKGHYYILWVSNQSTNVPNFTYSSRLSYYDN